MKTIGLNAITLFWLTYISGFFIPGCLQAQNGEKLRHESEKIIRFDLKIDFEKVPGFCIGVIDHDSTYIMGFGTTLRDSSFVPDGSTVYEVGGLTKVFTATLCEMLFSEGALSPDSTIKAYLRPDEQFPLADSITVLQLLTHTSGLPRLPLNLGTTDNFTDGPFANYTHEDLFDYLKKAEPTGKRGAYLYSHLNYALLEQIIENKTQMGYESYLQQRILQPLALNSTSITLTPGLKKALANGYSAGNLPVKPWTFRTFAGSDGLKSCVNDQLTWLKIAMGLQNSELFPLIQHSLSPAFPTGIDPNTSAAKGWHIMRQKKQYDVVVASGYTSGYSAFLGYVRETQTGIVVLANTQLGLNELGYLILRMVNQNWKRKK